MRDQPLGVGMVGPERRGQHERDLALAEHVARLVPHAGLEPGVGDHVEAERVAIEVRRLPRIAHEHPHVVDPPEGDFRGGHRVVVLPVGLQSVPERGDCVEDVVTALETGASYPTTRP